MTAQTCEQLRERKCRPCEGGVATMSSEEARAQLQQLAGWDLAGAGDRIRREWTLKNFMAAIDFFERIAHIAEEENHHPDLHLTRYRQVAVELTTHAIGGLSENDFILAAKIDALPVELRG